MSNAKNSQSANQSNRADGGGFGIPESLVSKYRGAGCALAAVSGGVLVDLVYFDSIFPDFSGEISEAAQLLASPEIGKATRELQALGDVLVGMCSCWEFVVL